ncbi:hypothetical protein VTN00DRAFT_8290 [Thermoascus crustaceus]|uniref:uncharacterized protein n=1 Tax=Thermoascus crustaceus TaxID=5088 RepID=UPI003741EB61
MLPQDQPELAMSRASSWSKHGEDGRGGKKGGSMDETEACLPHPGTGGEVVSRSLKEDGTGLHKGGPRSSCCEAPLGPSAASLLGSKHHLNARRATRSQRAPLLRPQQGTVLAP